MVFSLFSDNVGTKKVATGVPDELELGVPYLPDVEENTQLVDLLWPNSWTLFMLLKISIFRCVLTEQTRWWQNYSRIFIRTEVIDEENYFTDVKS